MANPGINGPRLEYGTFQSLADMLRQIGGDEGAHRAISLARMNRSA